MTAHDDVIDPWATPAWIVDGPVSTGTDGPGERPTARPRRRALSRLATLVLVVSLLLLTFVAYGASVDNRWYKIVAIQGGSMRPTFEVGDAIVITPPPQEVRTGMVLVMQVDEQVVTHRVVEVHDDGTFVTQGDANRVPDDFSQATVKVVGEQRARLPLLGRLLTRGR